MEQERLQKVIANAGIVSRRKAEEYIQKGRVKVDGKIITELGYKVSKHAIIMVDDIEIKRSQELRYVLLNKPRGVVTTTSDDKHRKTVVDLIDLPERIYPVGRLDYDTTGALLLTNDGTLAEFLMHPRSGIPKVYLAKVEGIIKGEHIVALKNGVVIDGRKTAKSRVKLRRVDIENQVSFVELTIHEGRNHQVKKMFEALGFSVIKLKRESIAFLSVKDLPSGEYRLLNKKEVARLYGLMKTSSNETI